MMSRFITCTVCPKEFVIEYEGLGKFSRVQHCAGGNHEDVGNFIAMYNVLAGGKLKKVEPVFGELIGS